MIVSFRPQHCCNMGIQTHFMGEEIEAPGSKSINQLVQLVSVRTGT